MYDQITPDQWVIGIVVSFIFLPLAAHVIFGYVNKLTEPTVKKPVVPVVDQPSATVKQPIATTDNEGNNVLIGSTVDLAEARDIIRFQAKVEALAELIKSKQVSNMAIGIEAVFDCTRTSKEDSTYQRARRAIDPLIQTGPKYNQLDEERKPI